MKTKKSTVKNHRRATKMRALPLSEVYRLLEPGPVVFVTTARAEKNNVMTMSWHTMMEFEPPLIGCVISNRDYTFNALRATKECVIAIPTEKIIKKVVRVGNTSGRDIDKFKTIGLTPMPASRVKAPLVGECYANLECKVVNTTLVNKYNFFVLEVVKAWIDPAVPKQPRTIHHRGNGVFMIAGKTVTLSSKMK
jgi:flavin reductase (DIM6/NTAB) family NADH-FMN oxidoreductase RutF